MPYSYNGWLASESGYNVEEFRIPGTNRDIILNAAAAPILLWAASQWHRRVEPIDTGQLDDWGWAYRNTRDGDTLSCHASGTAIDINALRYPRGTDNMSAAKEFEVRRIVSEINGASMRINGKRLVNWGGDWSGAYKDQMHIELSSGTDAADVARAYRELTRDWFDMATRADLEAVVKQALVEMEPTIQRICQEAVQAELGNAGAKVWAHQLPDPLSTTTPPKTYSAGSWLRGRDKTANSIVDRLTAIIRG